MKTQPLDFMLSALLISLIAGLDFVFVAGGVRPFSTLTLGPYHVLADGALFLFIYGVLSILCARLMLVFRPLRPGVYPMDHSLFTWWKLFTVNYEFGRGALLPFTSVFARPLLAKAFGASIGRDIALGGRLVDSHLISIGDEAIVGQDSVVTAHAITSGTLILRNVEIGRGATIGVNAVIMPGVVVGEGAIVAAGAVVTLDTQIPPNELWGGIPARKLKDVAPSDIRG